MNKDVRLNDISPNTKCFVHNLGYPIQRSQSATNKLAQHPFSEALRNSSQMSGIPQRFLKRISAIIIRQLPVLDPKPSQLDERGVGFVPTFSVP